MRILVVNNGSSSIKFSIFDVTGAADEPECRVDGEVSGVGADGSSLSLRFASAEEKTSHVPASTPDEAMHDLMDALESADSGAADAVGYRVVHPGPRLKGHLRITEEVLCELEKAAAFAPLHDPVVVTIIRAMMQRLPKAAHFACFDTVFHETMPEEASVYALPAKVRAEGVKRYGFHGLSCESIVRRMRLVTGEFPARAVIAHLGSGCSVTALLDGRSIDNTMGLTPTGGVVMGTRPGDLDPGLVLYLVRQHGGADAVEAMLNHEAGMVALSGMRNDVKAVREAAAKSDSAAALSLAVFTRSVRKAIGGFAWLLGGLDAVIFSGGIGEHDAQTRAEVLIGLEGMGIVMAEPAGKQMRNVSAAASTTAVWVVPAEEDLMIALHVREMLGREVNLQGRLRA